MRSAPRLAVASVLLLWPATALANPGPNPVAVMSFMALGALEVVASLVLLLGDRGRSSGVATTLAAILSFLGFSAVCTWELSIAFQVPAAIFIVIASRGREGSVMPKASVLLACTAVALTSYGVYQAQHPWSLFMASASVLGDGTPARGRDGGIRRTIESFVSIDAGPDDAGADAGR